jgi:hypothetical protein
MSAVTWSHRRALDFLNGYEPGCANLNVDFSRVFDERFVNKAMHARQDK